MGSKEIGFAVIAMTITLAAVFTPLSFAQGNTGKLMTEFALTVATSVIVSGFVALSLVPMMCSKMLKHEHSWVYRKTEPFFEGMVERIPRACSAATLRHRWVRRRRVRCGARWHVLVVHAAQGRSCLPKRTAACSWRS